MEHNKNKYLTAKTVLCMGIIVCCHPLQTHAEEYRYDDLGRLVEVIKNDFEFTGYDNTRQRATYIAHGTEQYEYDAVGNRIQKQSRASREKKIQ